MKEIKAYIRHNKAEIVIQKLEEAGSCPLCEMKLKEVSLDEAKDNLVKNGFKVK